MNNKDTLEIYIYSDSLGLPRGRDNILYEQTYAELFKLWNEANKSNKKVYIHNRSQGAIRIRKLIDLFEMDLSYFGNFCERIMVLHCGIVDCAPRPIPDFLRNIICRLPVKLQNPIIKFIHDNRPKILKSGLFWRATPPHKFKMLYQKLLKEAFDNFTRVYVFNILPTTKNIEKHSPGLSKSIKLYNRIIKECVESMKGNNISLIDVYSYADNKNGEIEKIVNIKDGHHLTLDGHKLFSNLLIDREKAFLNN